MKVTLLLTAVACCTLPAAALPNPNNIFPQEVRSGEIGEEGDFFEGDIEGIDPNASPDELDKSGLIAKNKRWPDAILYYQLDDVFTEEELQAIKMAMFEIHVTTCIQLVERQDEQTYVFVTKRSGCSSALGMGKGRQTLSLGADFCFRHGTIMHEFIHALGFTHEHNRPDRDDYVDIMWDNIQPGRESAFRKRTWETFTTFGLPYDYSSVMHYRAGSFAVDGSKPTITVKNGSPIGQRVYLSELDISKLRAMYECPDTVTQPATPAEFGGGEDIAFY